MSLAGRCRPSIKVVLEAYVGMGLPRGLGGQAGHGRREGAHPESNTGLQEAAQGWVSEHGSHEGQQITVGKETFKNRDLVKWPSKHPPSPHPLDSPAQGRAASGLHMDGRSSPFSG